MRKKLNPKTEASVDSRAKRNLRDMGRGPLPKPTKGSHAADSRL